MVKLDRLADARAEKMHKLDGREEIYPSDFLYALVADLIFGVALSF